MTRTTVTDRPPVTDGQKALLARLIEQGRIMVPTLIEADVASMSRGELARWLDAQLGRPQPSATTTSLVDDLFATVTTVSVVETDTASHQLPIDGGGETKPASKTGAAKARA